MLKPNHLLMKEFMSGSERGFVAFRITAVEDIRNFIWSGYYYLDANSGPLDTQSSPVEPEDEDGNSILFTKEDYTLIQAFVGINYPLLRMFTFIPKDMPGGRREEIGAPQLQTTGDLYLEKTVLLTILQDLLKS